MAVSPSYPGVYVQEVPSGVRTIVGVSTSVTLFVGRASSGPIDQPIRLFNYTDFKRVYGDDSTYGDLARHVRLFFQNGGTDCWVIRIARDAVASAVTLKNEAKTDVLRLRAKSAGALGEAIRASVSYATASPESTFSIELFRWAVDSRGQKVAVERESFTNLSMDPLAATYAPTILTQRSKLVDAEPVGAPGGNPGYSLAGAPLLYDDSGANDAAKVTAFVNAWQAAITASRKRFKVSVGNGAAVTVDLGSIGWSTVSGAANVTAAADALAAIIQTRINDALAPTQPGTTVAVTLPAGPQGASGQRSHLLRIAAASAAKHDVRVTSAESDDLAGALFLGTGNGGIEVGAYADRRPAPSGITFKAGELPAWLALAEVDPPAGLGSLTLDELQASGTLADKQLRGNVASPGTSDWVLPDTARFFLEPGNKLDGIRKHLTLIRDGVNAYQAAHPGTFRWRAELWGHRLALLPVAGPDNHVAAGFATGTVDLTTRFTRNVRLYSLGAAGSGDYQSHTLADVGSDGVAPRASDYDRAYEIADREIDLFNLLVLPPDAGVSDVERTQLWGPASVFCQKRRAFLLMDPPDAWGNFQDASTKVDELRVGLVKDFAALFYPRLRIAEDGREVTVTASGAMAGLFARTDAARGVWKAPAGIEADVRGVIGVDTMLSDAENGALNPVGVNAVRVFPDGVVSWGARTMAGADAFASEYKYIPVRRLALFIEESLYRGLKWVVFEPNDAGLWAQIRLNVGAFMHNLFRQGAFQGQKPSDAYFVKCDAETTTENDRNLGIVNVWVGFAPLKPAEFVILYLQQIAGQVQT